MKYKAVIFDLGGTLVRFPGWSGYAGAARKIASMPNASVEGFVRLWFEQGEGLGTGVFTGYEALIKHVCAQLGVNIEDHLVAAAANIPYNLTRQMITIPRDDTSHIQQPAGVRGITPGD